MYFFDLSNLVSIVEFIANTELVSNTKNIHEGTTMRMLPLFAKIVLATTLNSCMFIAAQVIPDVTSVNTTRPLMQRKLLRLYIRNS